MEIDAHTHCSLFSGYWTRLVLILQRPKLSVLSTAFPIQQLLWIQHLSKINMTS